jgi:hypothetical protein
MWRNLFVGNILDVFTTVRSNNAVRMEIRNYSTRKNQIKIPAVFMRGGTSKCLMFQEKDLPKDKALWDKIFLSPDPNERQMDGMGGGYSSVSKIMVISPSTRKDVDIDYLFGQVDIKTATVEYTGNCGNCTTAVAPYAIDERLVKAVEPETTVKLFNTNTNKIIHATVQISNGEAATEGEFITEGVPGTSSPIEMKFLAPGGSRTGKLLPSGYVVDKIAVDKHGYNTVPCTLIDSANPMVIVDGKMFGLNGRETPEEIDQNKKLQEVLEIIRTKGGDKMGIPFNQSFPKVIITNEASSYESLEGTTIDKSKMTFMAKIISLGKCHKALPLTGAICLATAAQIESSIVHNIIHSSGQDSPSDFTYIAHPSGIMPIKALVEQLSTGEWHVEYATVVQSARRLMEGSVCVAGSVLDQVE